MTKLTNTEISTWRQIVFDTLDIAEWANQIPIKWNSRLTTTLGRAHLNRQTVKTWTYHIELSSKAFALIDQKKQEEVLIHELCHIAAHIKYGTLGHDSAWRRCMIKCGVRPTRCPKLDQEANKKLSPRIAAACSCRTHQISKKMATMIRKGQTRICKRCRQRLILKV